MKRRARLASMADIVSAVRAEQLAEIENGSRWADARQIIRIDGVSFAMSEEPISPAEALAIAASSKLVIADPCGCGGSCGYETWQGPRVDTLIEAGPPEVRSGSLWQITDREGRCGVLIVFPARWGSLI